MSSHTPSASRVGTAARSLARVLRNADIRSLELSWTIGVGVDWAILVVALVVAYDAGGAVAVGLVSLTRMLPATLVNVVIDTSTSARPERVLVLVNAVRAIGAALVAAAIIVDAPVGAFVAVALASAAGALVRPTTLALLPSVAVEPEDLVSANTAGALGESLGTFAGPLLAGLVVATSGPAPAAALAAAAGIIAAVAVMRVRVADAARPAPRARGRARGLPLVEGLRELSRRRPAGVLMASFGVQVLVRGALTTFLAILAIEVLGMGDPGVGLLGAAIGAGGIVGAVLAVGVGTGGGLAAMFAVALIAWGVPLAVIGAVPMPAVALVALGITGVGNALLDVSGLTLLQRGTANRGAVFAVLEVMASLAVSIGALVASGLVATIGVEAALIASGLVLPVVAVAGWPWVRRLDHEGVLPEREARLLRGVPLFAPLPLTALERLAEGMRPVRFAPGEPLMVQGERGDTYVLLESGRVLVTIDGVDDHEQGPGDGVGEIALLRAVPRTATVTAIEPVEGFAIDCATFVDAVTGHEDSSRAAGEVVAARLGTGGPAA